MTNTLDSNLRSAQNRAKAWAEAKDMVRQWYLLKATGAVEGAGVQCEEVEDGPNSAGESKFYIEPLLKERNLVAVCRELGNTVWECRCVFVDTPVRSFGGL